MIMKQMTKLTQSSCLTAACLGITLLSASAAINAQDIVEEQATPVKTEKDYTFSEVVTESVIGDVYSDEAAANWQDLSYSNLFSKGWDKPWSSPPNGGGGAPRQGWLNASEGVFYRLAIATFGWQHDLGSKDGYSGTLTAFTPLNQRMEIQTDIPMVVSNGRTGTDNVSNFGDFKITPRFILSESRDTTQSFNVTFRTPTGVNANIGTNIAAITPSYEFWTNWWKGLVVRGGTGFFVPYGGDLNASGARSTYNANLAVGYYFTPHDFTPIGDMVWYLSTNLNQTIDNRGPSRTFVSLTPGFRTHVGDNWYLLGAVEVPVTSPQPFDYQVMSGIMKVF